MRQGRLKGIRPPADILELDTPTLATDTALRGINKARTFKEDTMYDLICFCKWCQHLRPEEIAGILKGLGFDGVDLPVRPGDPLDHENGPKELPRWKKIFEDHGLKLERLVTQLKEAGPVEERLLECCRELGIRKIRIADYSLNRVPDYRVVYDEARRGLKALEGILSKHGVAGGIQNHSGTRVGVNISSLMRVMEHCDPAWVGIQYDPGHNTVAGEPPRCALKLMGPHCHSVNFKSPRQINYMDPSTGKLSYRPMWGPLRDGMLDVPFVLEELQNEGYTDPISLHAEYGGYFFHVTSDIEATKKIVAQDIAYVRECMTSLASGTQR